MMRFGCYLKMRASAALLIIASLAFVTHAATIKTREGKTIDGKIRGMIFQKGDVETKKSGDSTTYLAMYDVSDGQDIEAIDEAGVHRSHIWQITVSGVGGLPDDLDVFKAGEKIGAGAERVTAKGLKYYVFVFDFAPRVPSTVKLLGELRNVNGRDVFIPAIHVTTKDAEVDIPISQIVPFKVAPKSNP